MYDDGQNGFGTIDTMIKFDGDGTCKQAFTFAVHFSRYQHREIEILSLIAISPGVSIELSSGKDRSLTVVLTGKGDSVRHARKMIVQQLQTQVCIFLCRFTYLWILWKMIYLYLNPNYIYDITG